MSPTPTPSGSTQRLASLPGVFHATDALLRARIPRDQLNQVLWRWKTAGYIKALGARSDVWFNLVVDPVMTRERWESAVRLALPASILAGHGVLMRAGVTTQMASSDYLIRPARSPSAAIEGVTLHERPALWIRKLHKVGAVIASSGLPELDPGAALADLLAYDAGAIDVDDIDLDDLSQTSLELYELLSTESGVALGQTERSKSMRQGSH